MLRLFCTFSKNDWTDFLNFSLPNLAGRTAEYTVVLYVQDHRRALKRGAITVPVLHKRLRPDLSRKAFLNILYKVERTINDFLVWQQLQKNDVQNRMFLIRAYQNRGLFDLQNKIAEETKRELKENLDTDVWSSLYLLMTCHEQYFSENPRILKKEAGRVILSEALIALNQFAGQFASFYELAIANRKKMLNESWDNEITQLQNLENVCDTWLVQLFKKLYILLYGDGSTYRELENHLFKPSISISPKIQELILLHLISFVLEEDKQRAEKYNSLDKLFRLYDFGLSSGLFLLDDKIPLRRFNNIVDMGCASGRIDWTRSFIDNWGTKVDEKHAGETIVLAIAQVDFAVRNYKEAVQRLIQYKFRTFSQELRSRWTMLRCDYELDGKDRDFMNKQIKSFSRYISRNKDEMSNTTYLGVSNFISILKRLVKNDNLAVIKQDFERYESLVLRSWLNEKITEKSEQA